MSENFLKGLMIVLAQIDGTLLQDAPKEFRDDKDIIMAVMEQFKCAIMYASNRLRDDWDVVMASVRKDGRLLQYASDRLRKNKRTIRTATRQRMKARAYYRRGYELV